MTSPEPVVGRARETALSIVIPEAEQPTAAFRARHLARAVARRIPAHVTVLYPFVEAEAVDGRLLERLSSHFAAFEPFEFELARIESFDAHVWLAPEPSERFIDVILRTCASFPEQPPYGGAFAGSVPTPHLTIGEGDVALLLALAHRELGGRLPLGGRVETVALLEEQADGTWMQRAHFALGDA